MVQHLLLVPVFDDLNRYIDCIDIDIDNVSGSGSSGAMFSQIAFSRFPGNAVRWVGPSDLVTRAGGSQTYFDNVLFLNGLGVTMDGDTVRFVNGRRAPRHTQRYSLMSARNAVRSTFTHSWF